MNALERGTELLWALSVALAINLSAAPAKSEVNACSLLSPAALEATMGERPQSTKPTSQVVGEVLFAQCFYSLPTFTKSVSIAVTAPGPADARRDAARHLWERWFHGDSLEDADSDHNVKPSSRNESEEQETKAKPEPVSGIGDEAFWVPSFVGNLYVRKGNQFLRISIGGKHTQEERLLKAKELARDALNRMP